MSTAVQAARAGTSALAANASSAVSPATRRSKRLGGLPRMVLPSR